MVERDLIQNDGHTPTYDEVVDYVLLPGRDLWQELNTFIQERYKAVPKIMYSKCSAKPGWNIKYQKSGKSLCTLYPEKEGFIALIVIVLDLVPIIEGIADEFVIEILELIRSAKPFNGTLWLMIRVNNEPVLQNVKQLLLLKQQL